MARTVYAHDGTKQTLATGTDVIKIALAGNPNSGKTTAFNELTGSVQYVGNWPGVTIEKKEGKLKGKKDVIIVDLPGIYSLSPYTLEEVVSRDFLINERPNAIINIVDASNLERNLYLATQLIETGLPVVVVLNMMDIIEKSGDTIDMKKLSERLGCPVMGASALKGTGLAEAVEKALELAHTLHHEQHHQDRPDHSFAEHIQADLTADEFAFEHGESHPEDPLAVSMEALAASHPSMRFDNRVEEAIEAIRPYVLSPAKEKGMSSRWLAIKFFEQDPRIMEQVKLPAAEQEAIRAVIKACEADYDDQSDSIIIDQRYSHIESFVKDVHVRKDNGLHTTSDRIDKIVTNPILAFPIFIAIMFGVYYIAIQSIGDFSVGFMEWLFGDVLGAGAAGFLENLGAAEWIVGLVEEGFIGGVGAVLSFVPQLIILFFLIALLEDCGYMSRVAFIMDRVFRRFGLSGKSIIPMVIGTGCSVPGIMATRTIETERERRMTIMLTPFIPCGAKLPVFALFIAAFFPDNPWIGPSMYFFGIIMVFVSGLILKNTKWFKGDSSPFIMELPPYRMPNPKNVVRSVWERASSFIIKAGTVIFVASGLIWLLSNFNFSLQMVDADESILASIGRVIAPIFAPIGFGTWQAAVATVTGLVAKEAVVSTMGVLYGIGEVMEDDPTLIAQVGQLFTPVSAYAFMTFTLLAAPCVAAIGAIKREMNSWKWTLATVAFQTGLAYVMALLVYQIGSLIF